MTVLRYIILALILLNIPSATMVYVSPVISNLLSILTYLFLLVYYVLSKKTGLNLWMIVLGLLYFSISSLSGQQYLPAEDRDFIVIIVKYFIMVICGYELLKNTSAKEITVFLIFGASTVILQIFFFNNPLIDYGRYSGFYLNPNNAGFMCLIGYGLSFAPQNKNIRLIGQIIFTIMGLLTFSRTFIALWLLTNLISVKIDIKNIRIFLYGFGLLIIFVIFSEFLPVKNPRLEQIKAIVNGEQVQTAEISEDSRTQTWSVYYDTLFEHPFFGNGFDTFSGNTHISPIGVHNTYLKVWGEAGILVLIVFLAMYGAMVKQSLNLFQTSPHLLLITISILLFLTTNHTYFDILYTLFLSMWIQGQLYGSDKLYPEPSNMIKN